jgi:hypothetical protein
MTRPPATRTPQTEPAELARLARWYRGIAADYRAAAAGDRAHRDELRDAADAAELRALNYAHAALDAPEEP